MHHALYLPVFGEFADATPPASLAADAAGRDGVFRWDHIAVCFAAGVPVVDMRAFVQEGPAG
jgi:hypothetical protein